MPNTRVPIIQQRLRADAESICFKCFHRNVCRAIDNQPCIECNQLTDANGVTAQQWIPVTERLPDNDTYILVTTDGVAASAYWHNDRFYAFTASGVATVGCVTHWMPLPEPPKGENHE